MEKKINFAAVLVAAVVHWLFGAAWFTFFSQQYIAGLRLTQAQLDAAKANASPVPYVVAFICSFGFAVVIARMISFSNMRTALGGARIGMMLGLGVAMLPMITECFFELKHLSFALVVSVYPAIGAVMMGAILGAWHKRSAAPMVQKAAA
jgi:Protein of unknown function (DUF1761)